MAAASAVYAAATMIYNAVNHHGVWNSATLIAAIALVSSLLTRQVVTPVTDPHDGNGNPLVTAPAPAVFPAVSSIRVPPEQTLSASPPASS